MCFVLNIMDIFYLTKNSKSTSHHKLHRRSNKVRIHTFNKKILSRMGSGAGDDRKDIRKVLFFHNLEAINFYSLGFGDCHKQDDFFVKRCENVGKSIFRKSSNGLGQVLSRWSGMVGKAAQKHYV